MKRILPTCFAFIASLLVQAQLDVPWTPLGGGMDQQVQTLLRLSNGDLLVAGQFNFAGNSVDNLVLCRRVARWDGMAYNAMPGFPEEFDIYCAAELNDTIYVGGRSTGSYHELMKWDGSTWTGGTVFGGMLPGVLALFVHGGVLHASGRISGVAGNGSAVQRMNGVVWESVGQGQVLNAEILCLGYYNGYLVCGGSFTGRVQSTANDIRRVAYLEGDTWRQLGDGLDGAVHDLLVYDNALYATGDMRSPTDSYFGLARITSEATTWEQLMPNIEDYVRAPVSGMMAGQSMVEHNGEIYIGGEFLIGTGSSVGRGLAVFHGAPDEVEAFGHFAGPVQAVALINDHELVVGGTSNTYRHIASTNLLTTGIADGVVRSSFSLAPNPVSDVVTIYLPEGMPENAPLRVLDMHGRAIGLPMERNGMQVRLDTRSLATGLYHLEAGDGGSIATGRFVKE